MSELQRQTYLQAMGIESFMPRLQLPGALPSQLCAMPVPVTVREDLPALITGRPETLTAPAAPQQTPIPVSNTASGSSVAALQALLGDKPPPSARKPVAAKPAATAESAASSAGQQTAKGLIPQFSLAIIRAQNLLIIDEGLPGHLNPNDYLQLLHNMLFAVGAGRQQLTIDRFVWPMTKHSPVDQTEIAARETLQSFIGKLCQQSAAQYLLLMGDTAAHYLAGQQQPKGELLVHGPLELSLVCTESASRMLQEPAVKAQVWQQLQPLCQALKA